VQFPPPHHYHQNCYLLGVTPCSLLDGSNISDEQCCLHLTGALSGMRASNLTSFIIADPQNKLSLHNHDVFSANNFKNIPFLHALTH
jgi:hypothetical protein